MNLGAGCRVKCHPTLEILAHRPEPMGVSLAMPFCERQSRDIVTGRLYLDGIANASCSVIRVTIAMTA